MGEQNPDCYKKASVETECSRGWNPSKPQVIRQYGLHAQIQLTRAMQEEQQKRRSRKREKRKKKGAKPGDEGSDEEDAFDSGDALSESASNPQPMPAPEPSQPVSKPEPAGKAAVAAAAEKEAAAPRPVPLKEDTNLQRPHTAKQNGAVSLKVLPPCAPPTPPSRRGFWAVSSVNIEVPKSTFSSVIGLDLVPMLSPHGMCLTGTG